MSSVLIAAEFLQALMAHAGARKYKLSKRRFCKLTRIRTQHRGCLHREKRLRLWQVPHGARSLMVLLVGTQMQ